MPLIQYVGLKDRKEDNVAGTGVVWDGPGDIQSVPAKAVPILLRHADVWVEPESGSGSDDGGEPGLANSQADTNPKPDAVVKTQATPPAAKSAPAAKKAAAKVKVPDGSEGAGEQSGADTNPNPDA